MLEIKKALFQYCVQYSEEKIKNTKDAIASARDAASNDTKSSAGDKYETTREMMQQEISRYQKQLTEAQKLRYALSLISPELISPNAQPGSLVFTDKGTFFISISAGQVLIDGVTYFAISPVSPIGSRLIGLKKGSHFQFSGKNYTILDVG